MYVIKRNGRRESVHFDKITSRVKKLCYGLSPLIEAEKVTQKVLVSGTPCIVVASSSFCFSFCQVCMGVYKGVQTFELDELAAETAAQLISTHPDYGLLAARISIDNLHKNTSKSFSEVAKMLHTYVEPKSGLAAPLLSDDVAEIISKNADRINSAIVYARDFDYDYFGFKTLEVRALPPLPAAFAHAL